MKIKDVLVSMIGIALTNEEKDFVSYYGNQITLSSLDDHGIWVAQNLVRKGIYEISNNDAQLIKTKNAFEPRPNTQKV